MAKNSDQLMRQWNAASHYRPLAGVADELMSPSGAIRPVWTQFLDYFSSLAPADIAGHFARGDEYLRDAGVYFRQYGQKSAIDRAWPLSHIPVLLHDSEWTGIAAALTQRAELLERVAADIYGPNALVAEGRLPASIVAGNPEWLRPMVGVKPAGGHFLHFLAFDIGRGPNGQWWVLEDRVQAPSGAGFALENRVATARVFSDYYADAHVHRLAGFFRRFRESLNQMRGAEENSIAILSPGPMTDTYYEHAYIARYLGIGLLEGEDLTVVNGRVMVRSVSGNRPISVLWRRMDATFTDPLEFDGASRLGTPGLAGAARQGHIAMVNALGAGALEAKALFAFLPGICEFLMGEPLAMPNVATWWCGQEQERRIVTAEAGHMVISPAVPPTRLAGRSARPSFGIDDSGAEFALTAENGRHFVGQETVTLSTTPTWEDGRLTPRPLSLRVYLARTLDGWTVMPGGFARIGHSNDPKAVAMQQGSAVADVWVVSDRKVSTETMLAEPTGPYIRPRPGALPSRAADNLYWLGRYVERAESTMRLMRAYFARLAEAGELESPLLSHVRSYIEGLDIEPDEAIPPALRNMFEAALGSASKIRDRFSVDGWLALNDLADSANRIAATSVVGDDSARAMGVLLRKITGFSGLVHENMYRFVGWRFLTIGRSLERALAMTSLLGRMTDENAPDGALDFAVEVGDSTLSHRRRYTVRTSRPTVIDLMALDGMNPRSILYQLNEIRTQVDLLPGAGVRGQMSELARAALRAQTDVAVRTPDGFDVEALDETWGQIALLSELITETYFK
ncbi:MAG: circularly permuted type 2 ATP-grasp protein [Rhizobiaceae bacterium]|nr:circularly permuted type 2 ATP-grasp protein [Rhizobiaceae bacterium]